MTAFDQSFPIIVGEEGGYDNDPRDSGNWTGGAVGSGTLLGTNWGISAAAFPTLDIPHLTQADAKAIYKPKYWDQVAGDALPPRVALYVFDAAVNSGVYHAAQWLQAAAGTATDGLVGAHTVAAVQRAYADDPAEFTGKLLGTRLIFMSDTAVWSVYRGGWATRVCALPVRAAALTA